MVTRVVAVDNPEMEGRFGNHYSLLVRTCSSSGFRPSEHAKTLSKEQLIILQELEEWLRISKTSGALGYSDKLPGVLGMGWAFNG